MAEVWEALMRRLVRPLLSPHAECDAQHVHPGMTLPHSGPIFATHWLGNLEQVTSPL